MSSLLEKYLEELGDRDKPLVASKLINLSGLSSAEIALFREMWCNLETERRLQVMKQLVTLAADNLELDFDEVFRLCLKDDNEQVRIKAIEGLEDCVECSLINPLICRIKEDENEPVRVAATKALGKFAMQAELGKLKAEAAAEVEAALLSVIENKAESLELRRRAIEAISPLSRPRVKEIIRQAYLSKNPSLRASALLAMGHNCDVAWLPVLMRELKSTEPEIRFEAARACGELEDERSVPHLVELIRDRDPQVQLSAIEALRNIGGEEAKRWLLACVNDDDERIGEAAQAALQELTFEEDPLSPF